MTSPPACANKAPANAPNITNTGTPPRGDPLAGVFQLRLQRGRQTHFISHSPPTAATAVAHRAADLRDLAVDGVEFSLDRQALPLEAFERLSALIQDALKLIDAKIRPRARTRHS